MKEYYFNICLKSIKHKSKNKHFKSKSHNHLSHFVRVKHQIKNPKLNEIEDILEKYINEYNKKFSIYWVECQIKTTSNTFSYPGRINIIITDPREKQQISKLIHRSPKILEMNMFFSSHFDNITWNHYLEIPKTMLEWTLIKKLSVNPEIINILNIRNFGYSNHDLE